MIGNETHARAALSGELPFIGEGCTRMAYAYDGIVYKVENVPGANHSEYENAGKVRATVPYPFVVPDMSLYYIDNSCVLAMPFIEGKATGECIGAYLGTGCDCDDECMTADIAYQANAINGDALSWGNTIRGNDGMYYIIDFDAVEFAS